MSQRLLRWTVLAKPKTTIWTAMVVLLLVLLAPSTALPQAGRTGSAPIGGAGYHVRGDIMIADQFNNRIIEVDPKTHQIVWTFGNGSSTAGPKSVVAPNDVQTVGPLNLISGTGAPPGAEPTCPSGCPDNRVMLVDIFGDVLWQYGEAGVTGSGPNQLNTPVQATFLPNFDVLITDQVNERVIEVTLYNQIVWQYGQTGVTGSGPDQLNNPNSAELLANGDILIADENNNRVIEVNRNHQIMWQYSNGISGAAFASRLQNEDTLITDSLNNRIVEVSKAGNVVWQYFTNTRKGSVANPNPTRAVRLENGNTLISDQFNMQVIEINPKGTIVFSQGQIGVAGTGFNQLNAPYDAKVIGDFTGLTAP